METPEETPTMNGNLEDLETLDEPVVELALLADTEGNTIMWHEPPGRTSVGIPDTASLWEALWENRAHLGGDAHIHPWDGPARPSYEDVTTWSAYDRGMRPRVHFVVTFTDEACFVREGGPTSITYRRLRDFPFRVDADGLRERAKRRTT